MEAEKVGLTGFHLKGEAQIWFHQLRTYRKGLNWDEFQHQITLRFGPPQGSNDLGELASLRQTETLEAYVAQFQQKLVHACHSVQYDQQVKLFMAGLSYSIRHNVEIQRPIHLDYVIHLA